MLVNNYEELLNSKMVLDPPEVNEICDEMITIQEPILEEREDFFRKRLYISSNVIILFCCPWTVRQFCHMQ